MFDVYHLLVHGEVRKLLNGKIFSSLVFSLAYNLSCFGVLENLSSPGTSFAICGIYRI